MLQTRSRGSTFGSILDANKGAGKGFDLLRLGLALLILLSHTSAITGHSGTTAWLTSLLFGQGHEAARGAGDALSLIPDAIQTTRHVGNDGTSGAGGGGGLSAPFIRALVPMFFALSGFLVSGSAQRTRRLIPFLGLRVIRIVPALFVEVVLSAIILGAFFTTLPLSDYFSNRQFHAYFLNILGIIQFHLPGVFQNNLETAVNANLWTLPFELECYAVMSILMLSGLLRNRLVFTILFAASTMVLIAANVLYGYHADLGIFDGRVLVYYFACGVLMYVWRDKIPFSYALVIGCAVASYFLLRLAHGTYIVPLLLTYITAFIGLMNLPQFTILKSGDYSYGIYLYSFPVTQALVTVIGRDVIPFPVMVLLAVIVTCLFAALSWHGVEKHFLKLKRFISKPSAKLTEGLHPDVPMTRHEAHGDPLNDPKQLKFDPR